MRIVFSTGDQVNNDGTQYKSDWNFCKSWASCQLWAGGERERATKKSAENAVLKFSSGKIERNGKWLLNSFSVQTFLAKCMNYANWEHKLSALSLLLTAVPNIRTRTIWNMVMEAKREREEKKN